MALFFSDPQPLPGNAFRWSAVEGPKSRSQRGLALFRLPDLVMKKTLLLLAVAASSIGSVAAQGLTYGVKLGANYANVWGKNAFDSYKYKAGFVGGLAANYAFNDLASLQVEALYSNKGFTLNDTEMTINGVKTKYEGKMNMNYLDVPILVKINAGPIFFEAGPQAGYRINSNRSSDFKVKGADGNVISEASNQSASDVLPGYTKIDANNGGIPRFDIGLIVGVGFNFTPQASIGVRYNAGVKSLVDTKATKAGDEPRIFNEAFQAQVGYMFGSTK
jgi:Outer membrane protein beta-barrel domain